MEETGWLAGLWEQIGIGMVIFAIFLIFVLYLARPYAHEMIKAAMGAVSHSLKTIGRIVSRLARSAYAEARQQARLYRIQEIERRVAFSANSMPEFFSPKLDSAVVQLQTAEELIKEMKEDFEGTKLTPPPVAEEGADPADVTAAKADWRSESEKRRGVLKGMLGKMRPLNSLLQKVSGLLENLSTDVAKFDENQKAFNAAVTSNEHAQGQAEASVIVRFVTAALFIPIIAGGALLNYQLIARPMAEIVGSSATLGGFPIYQVAAVVMILLEAAVGIVLLEALRVTHMLPVFDTLTRRMRLTLAGVAFGMLMTLALVEAGLAVVREALIEIDVAAERQITGAEASEASGVLGFVPVTVQVVLGFIIPFVLAMIAVPLEIFINTGRIIGQYALALVLSVTSALFHIVGLLLHHLKRVILALYDLVIFLPLAFEAVSSRLSSAPEPVPAGATASGGSNGSGGAATAKAPARRAKPRAVPDPDDSAGEDEGTGDEDKPPRPAATGRTQTTRRSRTQATRSGETRP